MTSRTHVPRQRRAAQPIGQSSSDVYRDLHHDLRQCLAAMMLLACVPDDELLDAETRHRFDLIRQTVRHATGMLEAASSTSAARLDAVDLGEVVARRVEVAEVTRKVRYVHACTERPTVFGDRLLLERALDNLIDNAGRAAGEGGDVVVELGTSATQVWVAVTDDGPGFGEIEHGTGRGLSIVTSTARACGGRLEISSGPGPGTTVRLKFPRHAAVPARR